MDRSTGDIRLKQTLEGHKSEYELLVSAYDGGKVVFSFVLFPYFLFFLFVISVYHFLFVCLNFFSIRPQEEIL